MGTTRRCLSRSLKSNDTKSQTHYLEETITYAFKDQRLLRQALVHSSFVHENRKKGWVSNERMEYLGDAVLNLVVGEFLYLNCPHIPEGELSRMRAAIVCERTLFGISLALGLGDILRFGQGEDRSGGRERPSILADALEALLGAVFLDAGYSAAKQVILHLFKDVLTEALNGDLFRDYKTMLQELVQSKKSGVISYPLLEETGPDHNKEFTISVCIDDVSVGQGWGRSKKDAEQQAAKEALLRLGK